MKNNEGQAASKDDSYFRVVSIKLDLNHHNHLVFPFSFRIKDDDTFNKIWFVWSQVGGEKHLVFRTSNVTHSWTEALWHRSLQYLFGWLLVTVTGSESSYPNRFLPTLPLAATFSCWLWGRELQISPKYYWYLLFSWDCQIQYSTKNSSFWWFGQLAPLDWRAKQGLAF